MNTQLYVLIALLPTTIYGIYTFKLPALMVLAITIGTTVLTEYGYQKLMRQKVTIKDLRAAVIGLLLALCLPPTVPWWLCVVGGALAVLVCKPVFWSLGQRFLNPTLCARCFLLIFFAERMNHYVYDGVSRVTPLTKLRMGKSVDLLDMFMGNTAGTIGETSTIAILLGAVFLIWMGAVCVRIPFMYLISFTICLAVFGGHGLDLRYLATHLCGGGLMFGVWFIATESVSVPISKGGQYIYGILLGILTGLFRIFGAEAEGVTCAILLGNLMVPFIERMLDLVYQLKYKEHIVLKSERESD